MWSSKQLAWHINCKELKAIHLALFHFNNLVRAKNSYLAFRQPSHTSEDKEGLAHARFRIAEELLLWTENHAISLMTRYIPGKSNVLADSLSHQN